LAALLLVVVVLVAAMGEVMSDRIRRAMPLADLAAAIWELATAAAPAGARSEHLRRTELTTAHVAAVRRATYACFRKVNIPAIRMVGAERTRQLHLAHRAAAMVAAQQAAVVAGKVDGALAVLRRMLALLTIGDQRQLEDELQRIEAAPELRRDLRLGGVDRYLPAAYAVLVSGTLALAISATVHAALWPVVIGLATAVPVLFQLTTNIWRQLRD
jgi:hypothetical protein